MIFYLLDIILFSMAYKNVEIGSVSGSVIDLPPGSGYLIRDYGSGSGRYTYAYTTLKQQEKSTKP
jgi:hypothetical protein